MEKVGRWLTQSESVYALTGAGVSTDSGIPDFRGKDGLWKDRDPMEVASSRALHEHPERFFRFWDEHFSKLGRVDPNITHQVLAQLEEANLLAGVVTQNIDGLHHKAGSENVFRLHGNYKVSKCEGCGREFSTAQIFQRFEAEGEVPRCRDCGGLIRPDVVLFNEQLPEAVTEAEKLLSRADLLLVLGSSLGVYPAASLVSHSKETGGKVVIINNDPTPYDHLADLVYRGGLAEAMEALKKNLNLR